MRNRKKRAALLLAGLLLTQTACAEENVSGTEEGTGNGIAESAEAGTQVSALAAMQAVNTGERVNAADNYRTWYEVFVYSFYDSDGDGIGDLPGLTEKLDYINDGDPSTDTDLGCDGIWLMPVMPSTTYHKYDVTDYRDIDPQYGTLADFETFVEECHGRGVNVIIDLVMNHSSSQHTWFQTAAEYLRMLSEGADPDPEACPYVDYYFFSREKESGYCELPGTDWYYEAQFWSEMPDLNLGSEAVREEFADIVDFWLELGVDGFRLDGAKEYYSGNTDANVEVLSWFDDMVREKKPDAYIVAEVWTDMLTYAKYYASGIDSCFDFAFADQTGTIANAVKGTAGALSYGRALESVQETIAPYNANYIDAPFYTNHDMGRSAGYYAGENSERQTKIAEAMNLLMTGSAFLYYGEELGMKGSGKDENKRAPMYWSKDAGAQGMCDGPVDMDHVSMKFDSLAEQQEDGNSIYQFVKQTIGIRNTYPAISHGTVTVEDSVSGDAVCVLRKSYEGEEVLLAFNLSESEQTVDLSGLALPEGEESGMQLGGALLTGAGEQIALDGTTLLLPPYSVAVLK